MLDGLPVLKELRCDNFVALGTNRHLTGNINSLRVLKDTLEKVTISQCFSVEGDIMDLADFPYLKELKLNDTAVTGDIRDIGENDFSSLERLILPKSVYGGDGYVLQRISDAPDLMRAVYLLKKQRQTLKMRGWLQRYHEAPLTGMNLRAKMKISCLHFPFASLKRHHAVDINGYRWVSQLATSVK
jgi:hypothetical protein